MGINGLGEKVTLFKCGKHGYRKKTRYILRYQKCDAPCRQPLIVRI